ncbi:unnamed protein product [Rotaria sp. Silwood1]|nr:unnamed protein product [Rotaria sp. Silwood1]CAF3783784.1 unnamed protein product [Rotaria sp. Silwood1]CAF4969122.1 unnamed protein product [Rotaria sp. Silwood1]
MHYASQPSLFTLNPHWIFDLIPKHFQTLFTHINSPQLFEKFSNKNFDQNNLTTAFNHWELRTLVNRHSKQQIQLDIKTDRLVFIIFVSYMSLKSNAHYICV